MMRSVFLSERWMGRALGLVLGAAALTVTAQPLAFTDATEAAGLAGLDGYGVAVTDYDGDGWDDVFVTTVRGASRLLRNNGDGTFTDAAAEAGVAATGQHLVALWGDLDNDGLPDLFLGRKTDGENKLFRNRGDGTFEDVTAEAGIDATADVGAAAFGDYDGDGRLDLFLAVDRAPDLLYHNLTEDAAIRFEDLSDRAGIAGPPTAVAMQATWIDFNHDGRLDLFGVHDGSTESRLYRNDGYLPLLETARAAGIADVGAGNSMGVAWGDFDGDGWEDAYVTRIGQAGLYRNNGDGTFTDVAVERGAHRNGMSWGVVFADFDNDADDDLFVVNTSGYDGTKSFLYRNDDGFFTDVAAGAGAALSMEAHGLAAGDFDRDGRPDLIVGATSGIKLLMNATPTEHHHVAIRLEGREANRMALGVRVEVVAGGRTLVRTVSGGDSFCSQSSPVLHVGLGDAERIDTLRIHWRAGVTEERFDLPADADLVFTEAAVATAVEDAALPDDFALAPNYPNPFNPRTTIPFALPRAAHVTLTVFDLLGRPVATLVDGRRAAGTHRVTFDAAGLPSGVYLYRLRAGTFTQTRALVILE
ncbi:FG-GAP-like repeat-containing protein [Rhodocaloribacter sp.]